MPKGDILIHAGDFTWSGREQPTLDFLDWLEAQSFKHKILVSGNHDFYFEHGKNLRQLEGRSIHYLMNNEIAIEGQIKVWGSPFTPEFMDWAFMGTPKEREALWAKIPEHLDILITHGPPLGVLDRAADGVNAGCPYLLKSVQSKLANERFVANAKPEVVAVEKKKQSDAEQKIKTLEEQLSTLK